MKLIVGLGNPGPSYAFTRHNLGFIVLDILNSSWKKAHQSEISKITIQDESVLLVKPQTYMNLSGQAVQEILSYYKIPKENLLVVHDDLDLQLLQMKFQKDRGAGGHNGVSHIHQCLGHSQYYRLKLGISPLENSPAYGHYKNNVHSYVLSPFSKDEKPYLEKLTMRAVEAIKYFIVHGGEKAGSLYNQKFSE